MNEMDISKERGNSALRLSAFTTPLICMMFFYEKACKMTDSYKIGYQLNEEATMGPLTTNFNMNKPYLTRNKRLSRS
jgi:hypothetical protein